MGRTESPLTTPVTNYYHGDMLGTTRLMTTSPPPPATPTTIEPAVYTAFGERITAPLVTDSTRYGYAGAWGYQQHADFPYLHVGARYYDPSSGRFLQRDPIGILGGRNVYEYLDSAPTRRVDPDGLFTIGLGFSGTVGFWPFYFQVEVSIHVGISSEGVSAGVTGSIGGGLNIGAGVSAGPVLTISDAPNVEDLLGTSTEVGVDTPIGSVGVFQGWSANPDKPSSGSVGMQIGGPGLIAGVRAGDNKTGGLTCTIIRW